VSARKGRGIQGSRAPLIIGLGNEDRGDDRCGLEVVRALRTRLKGDTRLVECLGIASDLLDLWEGEGTVFVVDAIRSGHAAGTITRLEVGDGPIPSPLSTTSTHGLSLAQAVALGQSLDRFPQRLIIYGIEAASFALGGGMTPAVANAVNETALRIMREISRTPGSSSRKGEETGHHA
jgi:hydrogenase maturation protease